MQVCHRIAFLAPVLVAVTATSLLAGQGQAPTPAPVPGQDRGQPSASPPPQPGHPSGKLFLWGDLALFVRPGEPDGCILSNRYRRGQMVGFRMTAIDGGTGEVENTAVLVVHVAYAGRTIDIPMRWRGAAGPKAPPPRGFLRPPVELWTGYWIVPADAQPGTVSYTVTATDRFGRTATFTPFSYETSQLTIVP